MGNSTRLSTTLKGRELPRASQRAKGVPTRTTMAMLIALVNRERRKAWRAIGLVRLARKLSCWAARTSKATTGRPINTK